MVHQGRSMDKVLPWSYNTHKKAIARNVKGYFHHLRQEPHINIFEHKDTYPSDPNSTYIHHTSIINLFRIAKVQREGFFFLYRSLSIFIDS
jgi:hypothetical protein